MGQQSRHRRRLIEGLFSWNVQPALRLTHETQGIHAGEGSLKGCVHALRSRDTFLPSSRCTGEMMSDERKKLEDVKAWAQRKIDAGLEPPWSWYEHMKLIDAIDSITAGMDVTAASESHLNVVHDADKPIPVQLPM